MKVSAVSGGPGAATPTKKVSEAKSQAKVRPPPLELRQGLTKEYLQMALTTRVGKSVEDALKVHGLSLSDAVGVDVSAEATSDRIVTGTTAMLGIFARQNPNLSKAELIDKFEQTIRGGIDRGYQEALSILEAVESFDEGIRGLGQRTIELVHEKLDGYFAKLRESIAEK